MTPGKPFSLFKRKRIYYARFKLPDGQWSTAKSTKQTTKGQAESWCIDYLKNGKIVKRESVKFAEFAIDFFTIDGEWATDRRTTGKRLSDHHCLERRDIVKNFLIPYFGEVKFTHIDRAKIREFRNGLFKKGYSGSTINKTLSTLKTILEWAEEKSLIQYTPKIERAAENHKHRGILTIDETRQLFSVEWHDYRGRVANLLAAVTGLRRGEILGLTLKDIHLNEGFICVQRSWDRRTRILNPTTKTGRARNVFIPGIIQEEIKELMRINPRSSMDSFLFFALIAKDKPVEDVIISRALYKALAEIGIDEKKRTERNITFHSWRHWFNSLLINAKIPLQKVQSLTGHLTEEMTQHYYHLDDMSDVLEVQESIFINDLC